MCAPLNLLCCVTILWPNRTDGEITGRTHELDALSDISDQDDVHPIGDDDIDGGMGRTDVLGNSLDEDEEDQAAREKNEAAMRRQGLRQRWAAAKPIAEQKWRDKDLFCISVGGPLQRLCNRIIDPDNDFAANIKQFFRAKCGSQAHQPKPQGPSCWKRCKRCTRRKVCCRKPAESGASDEEEHDEQSDFLKTTAQKRRAHRLNFDRIIVILIVISSLMLVLESPETRSNNTFRQINSVLEYVFVVAFTFEILVKVCAMGLVMHKGAYLRNAYNALDFVVVLASLLAVTQVGSSGVTEYVCDSRLERIFRCGAQAADCA